MMSDNSGISYIFSSKDDEVIILVHPFYGFPCEYTDFLKFNTDTKSAEKLGPQHGWKVVDGSNVGEAAVARSMEAGFADAKLVFSKVKNSET